METYLIHHGVLGQKWGVLRYQNRDGSLTTLGRQHLANRLSDLKNAGIDLQQKYEGKANRKSRKIEKIDRKIESAGDKTKKVEKLEAKREKVAEKGLVMYIMDRELGELILPFAN